MGIFVIESGRCELNNAGMQYTLDISRGDTFGESFALKQLVSLVL